MRHAEYPASPTLRDELVLKTTEIPENTSHEDALAAWSAYLDRDVPIVLVNNVERARALLMDAFGVEEGEYVGAPINSRRSLSESIKRANRHLPLFLELDQELEFRADSPGADQLRLVWSQPVGGMASPAALPGTTLFVDNGYTLPAPPFAENQDLVGSATVWGLHLSEAPRKAGAMIAFNDRDLYQAVCDLIDPEGDLPDPNRAMAQAQRVSGPDGLASRQINRFMASHYGMNLAAGVPMMTLDGVCSLPYGLAVRIPTEIDLPTFLSYGRNELVPVWWMPEIQPMFFAAMQLTQDMALSRETADNISRWLISPIGPDFLDEEVVHSVLVVTKASEYTGLRWYTNPERARWYHDLLMERYGPSHDAYRMAFSD